MRRGATARAAAKKNRLHTVRSPKAIDALRWLKAHNPYYSDVTIDQGRLSSIPKGAEIPGVQDLEPGGRPLPEDKGPAPDQTMPGGDAAESAYEMGGMRLLEVAPGPEKRRGEYWKPRMLRETKGRHTWRTRGRKSAPTRLLTLKHADSSAWPSTGYFQAVSGASLQVAHTGSDSPPRSGLGA